MDYVSARLSIAMAAMEAVAMLELKVTERLKAMDLILEAKSRRNAQGD